MKRWRRLAYLTRYGKQPLDQLMKLSLTDLALYEKAISDIIAQEQAPRK